LVKTNPGIIIFLQCKVPGSRLRKFSYLITIWDGIGFDGLTGPQEGNSRGAQAAIS